MRWADAIKTKRDMIFFDINFLCNTCGQTIKWQIITMPSPVPNHPRPIPAVMMPSISMGMNTRRVTIYLPPSPWLFQVGVWHRTGYKELDLVDYRTRNFKASGVSFFVCEAFWKKNHRNLSWKEYGNGDNGISGDNRFSPSWHWFIRVE